MIDYEIILQNRKTISIEIKDKVIVKVPYNIKKEELNTILKKKENWIKNKLDIVNNRTYLKDDEILFRGKVTKKDIKLQPFLKRNFVVYSDGKIIINVKKYEDVNIILKRWLKRYSLDMINEIIQKYQIYFNEKPKEIKVKEQKTIWGSCTYDNKLNFNYKLALATEKAMEYVVVHEMCHMVHKNHSKEFWKMVEKLMPEYKKEHEWLRKNGYLLKI